MNRKNLPVLGLLFLPLVAAHGQEGEISFKSTELAPGLYMLEGQGGFSGGNLGLSAGDDGVVLIDDGVAPLAPKLLAAIAEIAGQPADFVINTHLHGDHTGGNAALRESGATIIGHENVRRRMLADDDGSEPDSAKALPEITFSRSMTFHLNGHEAFVFHVASAHTDGDAVISFRDVDVIHAGDIFFNGVFPFIDLDSGGSVSGVLEAQDDILSLSGPATRIIPGHGPLAGKADLQAARDMLADARERVKKLVDAGKSDEDILAANPLAAYDDWSWQFITTEVMIRTLIRDLRETG